MSPAYPSGLRFDRIVVPTPFAVGPANVYVVPVEPVTVIDTGTNTPETEAALLRGLDAAGVSTSSIERVVVTHGHPDHYGLAPRLRALSGGAAEIMAGVDDIPKMASSRTMLDATGRLLLGEGMPVETLTEMGERGASRSFRDLHPRVDDVVGLRDGDRLAFEDFELEVLHLPGHTAGHVCLYDRESGALFSGDTLLLEITPNPLLEPDPSDPSERRRSLVQYTATLERLAGLPLTTVYPGHGPVIESPHTLIQEIRRHHRTRASDLEARLTPAGKTGWQLAVELFPNLQGFDNFLAVSEVVAHMDVLESEGRADAVVRDGVTYYRRPSRSEHAPVSAQAGVPLGHDPVGDLPGLVQSGLVDEQPDPELPH